MSASGHVPDFKFGTTSSGVYFEVHGTGTPLFLGFPVMASHALVFGDAAAQMRTGFLAGLTDRYQVLLVDYPSIGRSTTIPPLDLTVDRVCDDMLAVADAAGVKGFAWWGGTFGAVTGLALAARTDQVDALVCAGWSPLGTPYAGMVAAARAQLNDPPPHTRVILRDPGQYAQWSTFYGSLGDGWEAQTVQRIRCPRAVIYGDRAESSVGDCPLPIAATLRDRAPELRQLGWQLIEVPDADASLILDPDRLVPPARRFLDSIFHAS
jgi:pimeloyl-ACP methyl ester carboxylesterase